MNDGSVRRVPTNQAQTLVDGQKAKRFISNTVYKALKLGIEVKNLSTRDEKGALKARIQDARAKKATTAEKKAEAKRLKKEKREEEAISDS